MEEGYNRRDLIRDDINRNEVLTDNMIGGSIEGIAKLLTPSNISNEEWERSFPFKDRILGLSNLSFNEILDIIDIQEQRMLMMQMESTEDEFEANFNFVQYLGDSAYLRALLANSKEGFVTKRLTGAYKSINYEDGTVNKNSGLLGGLFRK
jgi:hypothetical protein